MQQRLAATSTPGGTYLRYTVCRPDPSKTLTTCARTARGVSREPEHDGFHPISAVVATTAETRDHLVRLGNRIFPIRSLGEKVQNF